MNDEKVTAILYATRRLNNASFDPDSDESILSRQYLRAIESVGNERLWQASLVAMQGMMSKWGSTDNLCINKLGTDSLLVAKALVAAYEEEIAKEER